MTTELVISADTPEHAELRRDVRQLCDQFGEEYWQQRDLNREYPEQFVATLTKAGYLSALIPTEYGGLGLGITEAAVILEEVNRSGGHAAISYASERRVFGHAIGANQGVQFPLARAYTQVVAADMMRNRAAALFDAGKKCGAEANAAKFVASEASWQAGNICLDVPGGYGFVDKYNVERKFRETRVYQVAPVNNNMILASLGQHVLGLPRSY
jgi:alkylation response protein AidB-like acyl-CoA dehydrogenase